jgi:hypothetical protein
LAGPCPELGQEISNVQMRPVYGWTWVQDHRGRIITGLGGLGTRSKSRRVRSRERGLICAAVVSVNRTAELVESGDAKSSPSFAQEDDSVSPVTPTGLLAGLAGTACRPSAICKEMC